jgi:pyruvate,water dikinase|tara:strand:- start:1 stop:222 length:222 start_codon:yes stop_codon:yes gene_type:complete
MAVYTTTLENINSGSLALVGGKGANLGELVSAGLPVPRAFCITTDAYRSFVDENAIAEPCVTSAHMAPPSPVC